MVNGSAGVVAEWSAGTQCTEGFQEFNPILDISIDSPTIAADAAAAGGVTFSSAEPGTAAIYTLSGGYAPGAQPLWTVRYDPCGFLGVGGTQSGTEPFVEESYYAKNGTPDPSGSQNGTETCVSGGAHLLGLGSASAYQPANKSGWYYNLTLQLADSLPLTDVGVLVNTSAGLLPEWNNAGQPWNSPPSGDLWESPPYASEWYCVLSSLNGSTLGVYPTQYPGQPITWQEFHPGQTLVTSSDVLMVVASSSLTGDQASVFGVNGAIVSGSQQL
ncbi:MAG: hypothetical protein L3K17_05355 [Thermoplasmata archaeon]|nr:hypothetical protein [Thermoplasmata archaeon]